MPGLRLGLTIYECDPKLSRHAMTRSDLLTVQLWIGGVTNRKTRTMMDVDACAEEEFNDWYNTEHMPVLSNLPGMLTARRFRAHHGRPSYIALYHVSDLSIYAKSSWTAVNKTPWTKRMRRYQHNRTYFMFVRTANST